MVDRGWDSVLSPLILMQDLHILKETRQKTVKDPHEDSD